jgi:hypothetical protein
VFNAGPPTSDVTAPMRRKIAIYVHPVHPLTRWYMLHWICAVWRDHGIETETCDDPGKFVDADIAFLHVDLTEVPAAYRALVDRYSLVVNGRRTSIAKRVISDNLVTRDGDYQGPVIVKSNPNHSGKFDDQVSLWRRLLTPGRRERLDRNLPRWLTGGAFAMTYQIYPSPADVPRMAWHLDRLVVEKFMPERLGDSYCVRFSKFLGDRQSSHIIVSDHPVILPQWARKIDVFEPEPHVLSALNGWRERLGIDYGKLDYTIVDGRPVLLDVNPTNGSAPRQELNPQTARKLADGIDVYFDRARQGLVESKV